MVADPREAKQPERTREGSDRHRRPGAEPGNEARSQLGAVNDPDRDRQEGKPGFQRAVAEDVLHELGEKEEEPGKRRADREPDGVGAGAIAVRKDPQRHQGLGAPQLDDDEGDQQDERARDRSQGQRIRPAAAGGLVQPVDQQRDPRGDGDGARQVEATRPAFTCRQHPRRSQRQHDADRHVDEQHPLPGEIVGDQAAE